MTDHPTTRHARHSGFTIAEAAVIVCVLAAVAALGVPRLTEAHTLTGDAQLRRGLDELRRAVVVYAAQHDNVPPGHPGGNPTTRPTGDVAAAQLTGWTDRQGAVTAQPNGVYRLGPYLRRIPVNPINGLDTFAIVGPGRSIRQATGAHGWLYQPSTLQVVPDAVGVDERGVAYIDY